MSGSPPSRTKRSVSEERRSRRPGWVQAGIQESSTFKFPIHLKAASTRCHVALASFCFHGFMGRQLEQAGVTVLHGRARFASPKEVCVRSLSGEVERLKGDVIVIATGSRPRSPKEVPVDHEHILDSDSILSMTYLPRSLVVLGEDSADPPRHRDHLRRAPHARFAPS